MIAASDDVVKSAGRVFAVLELFDEARTPLSATEVVRRLSFPQSSTVALLKTMVSLGYLAFDQFDRRYLPTMRVPMLGRWLMDAAGADGSLLHLIRTISADTAETVTLSAQTDLAMQFLHVERGTKPLTLTVNAGDRTALLTTVVGIVALSGRPDQTIARYVARANKQIHDPAQHADQAVVMKQVTEVRRRGFGVGDSEYSAGIGVLAWLLPPLSGDRRVVLSVAGAVDGIREAREHIIESVIAAMKVHLDAG
jgi:IclR family KDG regulon transcriptional repressor